MNKTNPLIQLFVRFKNYVLQGLGLCFIGLGILGIFLPVMPTTIFFLLALACFTRSSTRLENWLLAHPTFGPYLSDWQQYKVVPTHAKWLAAFGMSLGLYLMMQTTAPFAVVVFVALVEAGVLGYLIYCPSHRSQCPIKQLPWLRIVTCCSLFLLQFGALAWLTYQPAL